MANNVQSAQAVKDEIKRLKFNPDWKASFDTEWRETKEFFKRASNATGTYSVVELQQLFPAEGAASHRAA